MNPKVRPASRADLPAIIAIASATATASQWSDERYAAIFGEDGSRRTALVMEEKDVVQGFVVASMMGSEWEIENIAIAGPMQKRGLGKRLLAECVDLARRRGAASMFLEVRESNAAARGLYERLAFVENGRRRGYYHEPAEDALLYKLNL